MAVAAGALTIGPSAIGSAAPAPTPAQAAAKIASLETAMDKATEDYDTARAQLQDSQRRSAALGAKIAAQKVSVQKFRDDVGVVASAVYRNGGITQVSALLDSGSPQNFLDQMSTLDQLSKEQKATLDKLLTAQKTLSGQQASIDSEIATQKKHQLTLAARKASIEGDLATWKKLRSKAEYKAASDARRNGDAAAPAAIGTSSRGESRGSDGPEVEATGSARAAVQFAYSQIGKPYVWGADGPGSYDCSGLTMAAWHAAGKSLPHSSSMQYSSGRRVSVSNLQPGDLVFFGSPIHHVGIYVGGGKMVHAPVPGDSVKVASISIMPVVGAVRP